MKRLLVAFTLSVFIAMGILPSNTGAVATAYQPYISNYDINYYLDKDKEGRSTLDVTEEITVQFPVNRNKGIVREIPRKYNDHSVSLDLESVTRNGRDEPIYSESNSGDLRIIETGTDDYISGVQVFEFKYSMRDVTQFFEDTNRQEFYWDTNGTGWRSRIDNLSVTLNVDESLRSSLTGDTACYKGRYGSEEACSITSQADGVFTATTSNLGYGENISIAIGFEPETFSEYVPTIFERLFKIWIISLIPTSIIGLFMMIWMLVRARRWRYRDADMGPIAPEYIPPKDAGIAASAAVSPGVYAGMAAELTDLAVRRYIQIIETSPKKWYSTAKYDIKVIKDVSDLRAEEREVLSDIFGHLPKVDDRLALSKLSNNTTVYNRLQDNSKKLRDLMRGEYKLKEVDDQKRSWFGSTAKKLGILSILTLSPLPLVAAIVGFTLSKTLWVLSDKGLELRRYIKGLEMYIKVAEKDRLKMLQSPEGAEKVGTGNLDDPGQIVKLYERVLPYAVLLGQEKEWSKQIGEYYEKSGDSPSWYTGRTAFSAAAFSSSVSNFSSAVRATSASSSSSGGSGGGGFSGGGGGGGGGGFR